MREGVYTRVIANEYKYATICFFSLFLISVLLMLVAPDTVAIFLLVLIIGTLLISVTSFKKYLTWSNGASGEEQVIRELKKLGPSFVVINDIKLPNGYGNIDHIVIGRNGVFVIETKNNAANIKCNGDFWEQEKVGLFKIFQTPLDSPSKQVKKNSVSLREFLENRIEFTKKLWFDNIVVLSNQTAKITEMNNPTVTVLKLGELNHYIKLQNRVTLTDKEIKKLVACLVGLQRVEESHQIFKNLFEDLKTQIKGPAYWKFVKFGAVFGVLWLIFDEIFLYMFTESFYYDPLDIIYVFSTGGIIAVILGKFFLNIFEIKSKSEIANFMLASILGWLPFLLEFWIYVGFLEYISTSSTYILARIALVPLAMMLLNSIENFSSNFRHQKIQPSHAKPNR